MEATNRDLGEDKVVYGTTENSPVTFMNFPEDTLEQKAGSVGRIMPHTEVSP